MNVYPIITVAAKGLGDKRRARGISNPPKNTEGEEQGQKIAESKIETNTRTG